MFGHIAQFSQKMTRSRRCRAGVLLYFKRRQRQDGLFYGSLSQMTKHQQTLNVTCTFSLVCDFL